MAETNTNETLSSATASGTDTLKKDENKSIPENKTAPPTPQADKPLREATTPNTADKSVLLLLFLPLLPINQKAKRRSR